MADVTVSEGDWPAVAKAFHWSTALLLLVQIPLGWMAVRWPLSPTKLDLFVWHKSLGFVILLLVALRLAFRARSKRPPLPGAMAAWERVCAQIVHVLLYVLLIALPLSGWVISSASGVPFRLFRRIAVPALVGPDKAIQELASRVHLGLVVALVSLLALHVGAAAWHHFARHDTVLKAMLPRIH